MEGFDRCQRRRSFQRHEVSSMSKARLADGIGFDYLTSFHRNGDQFGKLVIELADTSNNKL